MSETPQGLVNPVKHVITEAMVRVREGKIDKFKRQSVVLFHKATRTMLKITDVGPVEMQPDGTIIVKNDSSDGLFF